MLLNLQKFPCAVCHNILSLLYSPFWTLKLNVESTEVIIWFSSLPCPTSSTSFLVQPLVQLAFCQHTKMSHGWSYFLISYNTFLCAQWCFKTIILGRAWWQTYNPSIQKAKVKETWAQAILAQKDRREDTKKTSACSALFQAPISTSAPDKFHSIFLSLMTINFKCISWYGYSTFFSS